jgi:hypothetical protein
VSHSGVKAQVWGFGSSKPPKVKVVNSSDVAVRDGKNPDEAELGATVLASTRIEGSAEPEKR